MKHILYATILSMLFAGPCWSDDEPTYDFRSQGKNEGTYKLRECIKKTSTEVPLSKKLAQDIAEKLYGNVLTSTAIKTLLLTGTQGVFFRDLLVPEGEMQEVNGIGLTYLTRVAKKCARKIPQNSAPEKS